jgi:DNA-binding transcriptional LysR family regulator
MDLKRFRYFTVAAAEGSFHRAAARLGLDQPALSRKIRQLEQDLGVVLFVRASTGVRLTPAGETLLADLERLIPQLDLACDRARRTAAGGAALLRIAVTPFASDSRFVAAALAAARRATPELEFRLCVMHARAQLEELKGGRIDLAVQHRRGPPPPDTAHRDLRIDRYQLAVRSGHPLTRHAPLRLADLQSYDFVFATQSQWPVVHQEWLSACERAGLAPTIAYETQSEGMFLNLISEGLAIGFANSGMRDRPYAGVSYLDVEDLDVRLPLTAIWKRDRETPAILRMVELLAEQEAAPRRGD